MMNWTGKLVGGLVGLTLGPLGAVVGVLLGHQYDEQAKKQARLSAHHPLEIGEQLFRSSFRVMGHIAKADGRVSESEIAAARSIMSELRLNPDQTRVAIGHFNDGKAPSFSLDQELGRLGELCEGRPHLLRVFLEIQVRAALAGNDLQGPSRAVLQKIARLLDLSLMELAHMEAALRIQRSRAHDARSSAGTARPNRPVQIDQAYGVLEVAASASDAEVLRAYRRQLSRHHPDKLKANGLPDSMVEHAKQRTQQIIEAYEYVKEIRAGRA